MRDKKTNVSHKCVPIGNNKKEKCKIGDKRNQVEATDVLLRDRTFCKLLLPLKVVFCS